MGMFDSVIVNCPKCGTLVELQSKAGKCEMEKYKIQQVPSEIALDLMGKTINCMCCSKQFKLWSNVPEFVSMKIV